MAATQERDEVKTEDLLPPELIIELRDPRLLVANPANYRTHPPEQMEHMRRSLRDLGQFRNVVVDQQDLILDGHGVVQGAVEVGWQTVAVHVFRGTEAQARLLMLAANEIARLAIDDDRVLTALLEQVQVDFGNLTGTAWTETELNQRLTVLAAEDYDDTEGAGEFADFDPVGDLDRTPFKFGRYGCAASAELYQAFTAAWLAYLAEHPNGLMEDFLRSVWDAGC